ncbi:tail protein [Planomicrobium soli]|uniref:Tail protein n=1 Tax=Planomicrobium soli TaxID=1176648 RepID=A0A2P8H7D3_9BACL|nr:phage tail domain-containing protein [Planomicrobium soli]PSL42123.1 tail protein [Planomicrobium soli]
MSVKLYDSNMKEIKLRGVRWLEFTPQPPEAEPHTENVWHGDIVLGKTRNSRLINTRLQYQAYDFLDYKLLRNELFAALDPIKDIWAVDQHVPGIRWHVSVQEVDIERINGKFAEVAVTLYSARPHAESIGTTLNPFTSESGIWAYGMGLEGDVAKQKYVHNTATFSIYNAGNLEVDPRESKLIIKLTSSTATASDLRITNSTTGEMWQYKGFFQSGDIITVDGVQARRNGLNIVKNTNLALISIAPGINQFKIEGITGGFEISFEFPFLYL